jgi:hypothetical protein
MVHDAGNVVTHDIPAEDPAAVLPRRTTESRPPGPVAAPTVVGRSKIVGTGTEAIRRSVEGNCRN